MNNPAVWRGIIHFLHSPLIPVDQVYIKMWYFLRINLRRLRPCIIKSYAIFACHIPAQV